MITELTPEQEAQLKIYAQKWRDIVLSTEPSNRAEAERGVRQLYQSLNRRIPQRIWFDSPEALCNAIHEKYLSDGSARQIFDRITDETARMWDDINLQLIGKSVEDYLMLTHRVIWQEISMPIYDTITQRVLHMTSNQTSFLYFAMEDYFSNYYGFKRMSEIIDGEALIHLNAGWWSPKGKVCLLSERPNRLYLDDNHRLHCEDGLSIGYPDGWGVYAWHGVRVPEYVIMRPQDITPDKILSEPDARVTHVMIERYGLGNFIRNGNFEKVQSDDYGDLYRIEFKNGGEPIVAIHVKDGSTDHNYFLSVPSHIRTAHEGVVWSIENNDPEIQL